MGPFREGDTVELTEWYGAHAKGERGTVVHVKNDGLLTVEKPNGSTFKAFSRRFKKVVELDPMKVKVGDTVTMTRGKAIVTDEVTGVRDHTHGSPRWVSFNLSEDAFGESPRAVALEGSGLDGWSLTDHQPAPVPKPQLPTAAHSVIRAKVTNGDTRTLSLFHDHGDNPHGPVNVWMAQLVVGGGAYSDDDIVSFDVLYDAGKDA